MNEDELKHELEEVIKDIEKFTNKLGDTIREVIGFPTF